MYSGSKISWVGTISPPITNSRTERRPRQIMTSSANAAADPTIRMTTIDTSVTMMLLSAVRPRSEV